MSFLTQTHITQQITGRQKFCPEAVLLFLCVLLIHFSLPETRLSVAATTRTTGVFALPPLNTRGSHKTRGVPYSEALVYSLLGLCLAMLLSTMIVALLVLLRRARVQKEHREKKPQQTSKDCLMVEAITQEANGVVPDRPRATETCVHCFTEQTIPQCLNGDPQRRHHYTNGVAHGHASRTMCERDDALRIICSPTQTSI